MNNYTAEEIADRQELVKPIVKAVHSARGFDLKEPKLSEHAGHWEAILSNVPTNQLDTVYRLGLEKRCTTAEQFAMIWDMKMESLTMRIQHRAQQDAAKSKPTNNPIPEDILKRWEAAGSKSQ